VHFTPANLVAKFHRSIEPPQTQRTLQAIFRDPDRFVVHAPVPGGQGMGDEGAANHTRFAPSPGSRGLHVFVYGHRALRPLSEQPQRFPSRQSLEAFDAVRRQHGLSEEQVVFAQQHPAAIDAGVFHNDVIAVGHASVFLYHECAYVNSAEVIVELQARFRALHPGHDLTLVRVPDARVPLADAVRSYLFNSQLVSLPDGTLTLIAPTHCSDTPSVRTFLEELTSRSDSAIRQVHYFDLRQSMRNGGGPACLRLRVVLNEREVAALDPRVRLTEETYRRLTAWVRQHYRDDLGPEDLADPRLLEETRHALDELTQLLGLGSIYPFQLPA
jgi:succinylarginine dihydrolase